MSLRVQLISLNIVCASRVTASQEEQTRQVLSIPDEICAS